MVRARPALRDLSEETVHVLVLMSSTLREPQTGSTKLRSIEA
jgi:hypothetical protein